MAEMSGEGASADLMESPEPKKELSEIEDGVP